MSDFTLKDLEEIIAILEEQAKKPPTPPDMFMCADVIEDFHNEGMLESIMKEYNVIVGSSGYAKLVELGYLKIIPESKADES